MQPIYKAKLERVVNGDIVDLIVDVGFYISVHQRFRLKGIAWDFWCQQGFSPIQTRNCCKGICSRFAAQNNNIIRSHHTGKYGRWIADIWRYYWIMDWLIRYEDEKGKGDKGRWAKRSIKSSLLIPYPLFHAQLRLFQARSEQITPGEITTSLVALFLRFSDWMQKQMALLLT